MMTEKVYVLGHKNPDTDSICSAIAYAELKQRLGMNAVPGRLGEVNRETKFVLRYFDILTPERIETVKKQVSDLKMDPIYSLSPETPVKTTWNIMKKTNLKSLPVVDQNEKLIGIVTLSDITNKYMDAVDHNMIAASKTPLLNIADTLEARIITGEQKDFLTTGRIEVLAAEPHQLVNYIEKGDIVIAGNKPESVIKAIELGANCVILTCCNEIEEQIIQSAKQHQCVLMITKMDTFTTTRLINQSIPIGYVMTTRDIIKFDWDDFIDEVKDTMLSTRYRSYPVVDSSNKVMGFISRYHIISQNKKKVILVDHNEMSQTVHGIEEAEILEIIDHHRLGDIQTGNPILFKNEPVGSTATLVANMYFDAGITPSKNIAGIMCSAILSDTLKFKSPTSTYLDKVTAERLAEFAGLDIDSYAMQMFKEGSTLKGRTPQEILNTDFKDFEFNRNKIGIGQIYTIDIESANEIRQDTLSYMSAVCSDRSYDLIMLLITDILNQGSELLFVGHHKELIGKAFKTETKDDSVYLPGVVSRKKQVIPNIINALEQ